MHTRERTGWCTAATLAPILFLVPVAIGLLVSLVRLVGLGHPVYGWSMGINADAEAMALGQWPAQDPAHGFTGDAYTPLYTFVVSLFNRVHLWTGWAIVVTLVSTVALMVIVAWLAWRPEGGRYALLSAAGLGALAFSVVYGLERNAIYEARPTQFAWALAFGGVCLAPAMRGGVAPRLLSLVLLSAAFWAKQTAFIGWVAAAAVVVVMCWGGQLRLRAALAWLGGLVALNLVVFAVLQLATDGWQGRFAFGIELPVSHSLSDFLPDAALRAAPGIAFAAVAGALALWTSDRGRARDWARSADSRALAAVGMTILAVLGGLSGLYLLRYEGGDDNNLVPAFWALGALGAFWYARAAVASRTAMAATVLGVSLFLAGTLGGRAALRGGAFLPEVSWAELPPPVERYARNHLVWHPLLSDLNVDSQRVVYPNFQHMLEVLFRGREPGYLLDAVRARRFDAIYDLPREDQRTRATNHSVGEDNWFWKFDRIVEALYRSAPPGSGVPALPGGPAYATVGAARAYVPRPGRNPAPWLSSCLEPLHVGDHEFEVRAGGGFWCTFVPGRLELRVTPAAVSQALTTVPVDGLQGLVRVRMARTAGYWRLVVGNWELRGTVGAGGDGLGIELREGGVTVKHIHIDAAALHDSQGWLGVALTAGAPAVQRVGGAKVAVRAPDEKAPLEVWGTRRSNLQVDLARLRGV